MLVVRLILAGDANSSLKMAGVLVRSCWTISQHHPTKHEGEEEGSSFSFKRDGCFGSSTVSLPPSSDLWLYEGRLNRQNLRSLDREKSFRAELGLAELWWSFSV